jgi:hypothetical protein
MLLTLSARCVKSMLLPTGRGKKPTLDMLDLPKFTRETLGLNGLTLSTDLLAGSDRARLESIRERGDRAGCACLLLVEHDPQNFGSNSESAVLAAVERTRRVIEAAQILGCSAAAVKIQAGDDDAALARVALALKPVVERAEKLDMNILLSPHDGLTSRPERITELLKKIGGFRIGTYPDFEIASASKDPMSYLQRLTPYATAVCAATVKLLDPDDEAAKLKPVKKKPVEIEDEEVLPTKAKAGAKGKKEKGKPAAKVEPEPAEAEEELVEDDEIEALIDEALADHDDEPPPLVARKHAPYDLVPLVQAIANVGYDGPLALEYRGKDDLTVALVQSRDTLLALIAATRG